MRDALLLDGAVDVAYPGRECHLGELRRDHDPVPLDVREVVEDQARHREVAQVIEAGGVLRLVQLFGERVVVRLEEIGRASCRERAEILWDYEATKSKNERSERYRLIIV